MKMKCPHCQVKGHIPENLAGKVVRCPRCHNRFKVPDLDLWPQAPAVDRPLAAPKAGGESDTVPRPVVEKGIDHSVQSAESTVATEQQQEGAAVPDQPVPSGEGGDGDFPDLSEQHVSWHNAHAVEERPDSIGVDREAERVPSADHTGSSSKRRIDHELQEDLSQLLSGEEAVRRQQPEAADSAETFSIQVETQLAEGEKDGVEGSLGVVEVLKESWRMVSGIKASLWAGIGVTVALLAVLELISQLFLPLARSLVGQTVAIWSDIAISLVSSLLSMTCMAGLLTMAVNRVGDRPFSWRMVFAAFPFIGQIAAAATLMTLLVLSGMLLLVLPGIYLIVGYSLALPLIVVKRCGPWQALEMSRQLIHRHWWTVFACYCVIHLLYVIACIPMGLGLIWIVPMWFTLTGVLYRRLAADITVP